ncbi:Uncharacterized protein AXF42_Ash000461 [Apostasia shenzhenica]|uniref:RanBP2-type domain-containing protein n=1 Tax=Apostasia shenzhenica TaxID=1088818 RepID=A0A2I0AGK3_9ASPA|nr:Uncharacterized protein AXF42_Ash000461 [Apostasia shenzhenica]
MDRFGGRGRITRGMIPLLALHVATELRRLQRKPPVTAGLIVANTLIYLRPGALHRLLPSLEDVWFNPYLIVKQFWSVSLFNGHFNLLCRLLRFLQLMSNAEIDATSKYGDLKRFFLSAFYHIDEPHLVYNMMSLLWKGIQLETSMGSAEFASMVGALLCLSQGISLILAKSLFLFFDYEKAYYYQYSAGFSGVLFGLKVVLNAQSDDYTYMQGLLIPARYAAWAELILIQMFVPSASFIGHLGGILAGLIFLKLRGSYSGPDPIAALLRKVVSVMSWPVKLVRGLIARPAWGRGRVGSSRNGRRANEVWRCPVCTYDNSVTVEICEMCRTESMLNSAPTPSRSSRELSLEEVRRRRLERFSR